MKMNTQQTSNRWEKEVRRTPQTMNCGSFNSACVKELNRLTIWWVDRPTAASWGESEWRGRGGAFPTSQSPSQLTTRTNRVVVTHGFPPWLNAQHSPFLILQNHAPSHFSCREHRWLGYLIKMRVYMMPQLNICPMARYTIGDHSNPKHNITKSMVGIFPLAPHHDCLQYMYDLYLMQTELKLGCYIPLPLQ